jgi:hypothetical protein
MHKNLVSSVLSGLASKFNVKKGQSRWDAKIFSENGEEIAEIKKEEGSQFRLLSRKDHREWVLSSKIDGEHRRFSFSVREKGEREDADPLLVIRDNIFKHDGKFYMLANHPTGKLWQHHVNSPIRYISRLDNFPYSDVFEMEEDKHHQSLRDKLKRFRGVPVGEASGLGATPEGHNVKVNNELDDIGLFLAATSYLMYATA